MMPAHRSHRPTTMGRAAQVLAGIGALALLAWLPYSPALYFALCFDSPVSFDEADRNHDAYVSVLEAGYSCNVDSRPVKRDGHACTEYFSRIDWTPVKTVCE